MMMQLFVALDSLKRFRPQLNSDMKLDDIIVDNQEDQPLKLKFTEFGVSPWDAEVYNGMCIQPLSNRWIQPAELTCVCRFVFLVEVMW